MAKRSSVREFCHDVSSRFRSLRDACEDIDDSRAKFGLPAKWRPLRPDVSEEEIRKNDDYERAFAEWEKKFKKRESKAALAVTKSWGANWQQDLKKPYALAIREIGEKGCCLSEREIAPLLNPNGLNGIPWDATPRRVPIAVQHSGDGRKLHGLRPHIRCCVTVVRGDRTSS